MRRRQLIQYAAAAAATPVLPALAQGAGGFPNKPIRLLIAFPAGGPTDITMRQLADNAGKILGQPVVVENKPGAGGTLPAQQLQTSPADGYTLAQIPLGVFRLPYTTKITWDPVKDISYVINVTGYAFGIVVPADSPIKTWNDFVAYAKANPGKLSYGSTGTLTSPHLTTELIAQQAGHAAAITSRTRAAPSWRRRSPAATSWPRPTPPASRRWCRPASCACSTPGARSGWTSSPMRPRSRSWAWTSCRTRRSASARRAARRPTVVKRLHDAFKKAMEDPSYAQALARYDMLPMYMSSAAVQQVRAGHVRHGEGAGREAGPGQAQLSFAGRRRSIGGVRRMNRRRLPGRAAGGGATIRPCARTSRSSGCRPATATWTCPTRAATPCWPTAMPRP